MLLDYLVLGSAAGQNQYGTILATLVVFVVLMLLLKKFAWGPLMGIMQQREELVAYEIESAEKSRKEAHELLEEQRSLLKEARTEAQAIVENAKQQAILQKEEIVSSAKAEAVRLQESAKRDIESEKEKAIAAVREEVVSLSVLAATKVLNKEVSTEDNRTLIEETIAKAGEAR
ncbi:MAG: F0F1 ATP synthase subunit B [Kurthia gibsonii]|uniref:ATP synthase subunit b n=1 Tax=Kurthia gibsonii TaxID=33946 RepID=A0ABU9LIP5_9BACL|nr:MULTISPECIES: F0F1 ATP synthase subunit B [Kurthia]MCA9723863.1 F0F1 ATP synthase subunit B [Kurthia sp.]AMA62755.1 ATP synthase F0, B subunit [Kurthia sp. 11kri321]MEB6112963.1 F0F1 ATP synthase subunit B [Kurthia gibsonii]MEB7772023.1 F0F1 ATP synthase subunit B [Kurthia gibsonii]RXH50972.1 ATP synthase F0 subunit B [Kurthia gibsonii]